MPVRVDAGRRCADLLAALARSANVRLSLAETGISACWAYRQRRADPDFARRWRAAVAGARRRIAKEVAARARDPKAARPGGAVAAGMMAAGSSGKDTLRLERVKPTRFTDERRAAFLDALRATCNVRAAARATRVSAHAVYLHYHANAAFRDAWNATLAEGRVHLELAMLGAARKLFEPPEEQTHPPVTSGDVTGMDANVALQLLRLHAPRDAAGRSRKRWVKPADPEATRAEILAKIAAVRAAGVRRGGGTDAP